MVWAPPPSGWTDERVELLKILWPTGLSASQMAKQIGGGISRCAVIGKGKRMGLPGRKPPSEPGERQAKSQPRLPRDDAKATTSPESHPWRPAGGNNLHPAGNRVYLVSDDRPLPPPRVEGPGLATCLTIGLHMCRWPIGDPRDDDFTFCGRDAPEGPYCDHHRAIAYQAAPVSQGPRTEAQKLGDQKRRATFLRKWSERRSA